MTQPAQTVAPPGTTREELARIWALSWPVSVAGLGMLMMGLVDTAFVGVLGDQAVAAMASANMWVHGLGIAARGVVMGITPIVAQAEGRGDAEGSAAGLRAVLVVSLGVAAVLFVAYQFAAPGLRWLGQPEVILPEVAGYCRAVAWGLPGFMAFWALNQYLQGLGRMRPATVAVLLANLANVGLTGSLVNGWFGLPALGVVGAGYATAVSSWLLFLLLGLLERDVLVADLSRSSGFGPVGALLALGLPLAGQLALEVWAFTGSGLLVGWMGTTELAAHQVALLLASVAFMVPLGVSAGATTRIGNLVGAGHAWTRSGWVAVGMGCGVMGVTGMLFLTVPEALSSLFLPVGPGRALAATLLPVAGAFQLMDGVQVSAHGVLRGAGDVRVPALFNLVAYWLLALPFAYWVGWRQGGGAIGVWTGLVIGLGTVSVLLVGRLWWMGRAARAG